MAEPIVIDGWECKTYEGGARGASPVDEGGDTGVLVHANGALSTTIDRYVPPAVVSWLVRPLLHDAWERGCAAMAHDKNPYLDKDTSND